MAIQETQLVILPDGDSRGGKGGLFERFIAKLLSDQYGFESPKAQNLNVTAEGIELDVTARHKLTGAKAVAECKAYTRNVKSAELTNFYGKLTIERFKDEGIFGLFCALPRLTPDGQEKARAIEVEDSHFRYLSADDLAEALLQGGVITNPPASITDLSDMAVVVTEYGVYAACIVLDNTQRTPVQTAIWGPAGEVPDAVCDLLEASDYSNGLSVTDVGSPLGARSTNVTPNSVTLTSVAGSSSDFEYQLPASPRYFVGRSALIKRLEEVLLQDRGSVLVLNAQSGWGKSSLALKLGDLVTRRRGVSIILDTRTADQPRYVVEVLRRVGEEAQSRGIIELPESASWASLESATATFRASKWDSTKRPILVFFDQFENVFRDMELTRTFRDLALGAHDIAGPLFIGFAWKTDLVGWTEGHPYQLRDDIRSAGKVLTMEPFGPREVDVILGRLATQAGVRLLPDLKSRLRAYSQGLPWLLKKLADHVLRELRSGETQEGLLAESLNVIALFESDLAELSPVEHGVVRHVARYAPIAASEVTERFGPDSVQSLVDRRLIVQVGDRLDTYWDTFRDFLNTGSVPIQDSWILRQTPNSVARLLPIVVAAGGRLSVKELERILGRSDRSIFNVSRELRLLGITAHESNYVRLVDEVLDAADRELEMRGRVGGALRKHKAYTALRELSERNGGVTLDSFSRELPNSFPAVAVAKTAWTSYARAFLFWMEYAGLVIRQGDEYRPTNDVLPIPTVRLLDAPPPMRYRPGVPQIAPRRAVELLTRIHSEGEVPIPSSPKEREAVGTLLALGAVAVSQSKSVSLVASSLVDADGNIDPTVLRRLLSSVPGGPEGLALLQADGQAAPRSVGEVIANATNSKWSEQTIHGVGGSFRAWAKLAGLEIRHPSRRAKTS
ncbi:restriction endonuclease [Rhodococcus sp. KRD162]|uniref:nSTAND1 domain-containing NTPase n=1 Tax=Rhodococcus sp. KRD162 TaxID=2729725 RepID=UPI0019D2157C|nr:restriction endonuclease [Rhodococcus sp. KRD162]